MVQGFLIGLGQESFFAAVRRGQTFIFSPLDIIFIIANHVINTSFFTPPFTPPPLSYSRNLSILLQFKVFWGGYSKRRCYATTHSQALGCGLIHSPALTEFSVKILLLISIFHNLIETGPIYSYLHNNNKFL